MGHMTAHYMCQTHLGVISQTMPVIQKVLIYGIINSSLDVLIFSMLCVGRLSYAYLFEKSYIGCFMWILYEKELRIVLLLNLTQTNFQITIYFTLTQYSLCSSISALK